MDFDSFFLDDDAIDELLELHEAAVRELGDDAASVAYADLSFSVSKHGTVERLYGTQITRIESHHDPRVLLAIIERDGEETIRVAFGGQSAAKVRRKLIELLGNEYQNNPEKQHLRVYFKRKLMQDMEL